ncbi:hypothetical protein LTR95_014945 [Oleoguttula sp. CCFEE 5521]
MPFREKAKSFFRRPARSDSSTNTTSSSSNDSRWPSNVYKPGEPMPRPKYRAPPKKEHKEKLEAFSFGEAWRRKSFQSQYSPMGTRAPSRRGSWIERRRSMRSGRTGSVASMASGKSGGGVHRREYVGAGAAVATRLSVEIENEGDDDVANVGLSRVQSRDRNPRSRVGSTHRSRQRTAEHVTPVPPPNELGHSLYKPMTAHDHQPFSEHDLALALNRSHLAVPAN